MAEQVAMRKTTKKPCCICRQWFRPNTRVGNRQRACPKPSCQASRRLRTQADWRRRNPDYFIARRVQARSIAPAPVEPLRLRSPLSRLPWDLAQDQFGSQGADFIGIMGTLILSAAQDQFRADPFDSS